MTQVRVKVPRVVYNVSNPGPRRQTMSLAMAASYADRRPRVANNSPSLELLEPRIALSSLGLLTAPLAPSEPGTMPVHLAPSPVTGGGVSITDLSSGDPPAPVAPPGSDPILPGISPDLPLESPTIPPELPAQSGPGSTVEIEGGVTSLPTDSPGDLTSPSIDESSSLSGDPGLHGEPEAGSARPIPKIVGVSPSGGIEVEAGSINPIELTFEATIDPSTFRTDGLTLERSEEGGPTRVIFGPERPAQFRVEGDGTRVLLLHDGPLTPGRYRLLLDADAVFASNTGGIVIGTRGMVLSEFRVRSAPTSTSKPSSPITPPKAPSDTPTNPTPTTPPRSIPAPVKRPRGIAFDDAVPIAIVPGTIHRERGSIDLQDNPGAVALYRVEVPKGHRWRLGLEIDAAQNGVSPTTRLTLFGANGQVIRSIISVSPDAPSNPSLFAGVEAGTYYIGVSDPSNDPSNSEPGRGGRPGLSGSFEIAVVIDPDDEPVRLAGLRMDHADPADPVPTGFTLRFDGPITRASRDGSSALGPFEGPVEVSDADGRRWPVVVASFDESTASLSVVFIERPASGSYTVRLLESGDLVDLTGRAVLGRSGDRFLGEFQVRTEATDRRPNDLGAIAPKAAIEGISQHVRAVAGGMATIRFVLTHRETYLLQVVDASGPVRFGLIGPGGEVPIGVDPRSFNGAPLTLEPGVYELRIANPGDREFEGTFGIRTLATSLESLSGNGFGQEPSLSVRLISAADGTAEARSNPSVDPSTSARSVSSATSATAPEPLDANTNVGPTSPEADVDAPGTLDGSKPLLLTFETAPIGRPRFETYRVAAIASGSTGGVLALASAGRLAKPLQINDVSRSDRGPSVAVPATVAIGQSSDHLGKALRDRPSPTPERPAGPAIASRRSPLDDAALTRIALAMSGGAVQGHPGAAVEESSMGVVEGEDGPRIEVSLVRVLGVGMVSAWGARRWDRRRGVGKSARSARLG